jgi:hypothetical protein
MILSAQVYRENLPPVVDADGELVALDATPVVTFWRNGEVDVSVTPTIEQYSTGLYVVEATITGTVGDSVWCSVFVEDMDPTTIVLPVRILQSVPTVAALQTVDDELATLDGVVDLIAAGTTVVRANNSAGEVIAAADEIQDAVAEKIAHIILRRTMASVEASSDGEAVSLSSLYGLIQQAQESSRSSTTLTVKQTDGSTTLGTKTLTVNASANPITGIS